MAFQDSKVREDVHDGSRVRGTSRRSEGGAVREANLAFNVA